LKRAVPLKRTVKGWGRGGADLELSQKMNCLKVREIKRWEKKSAGTEKGGGGNREKRGGGKG